MYVRGIKNGVSICEDVSNATFATGIEPFPANISASEILSDIEIFSYNMKKNNKNGTESNHEMRVWGFSAQDLASKVDNIVNEGGEDQFKEPWTYNAKSLEGFLVQAIKELKLENNKAQVRNRRFEEEIYTILQIALVEMLVI